VTAPSTATPATTADLLARHGDAVMQTYGVPSLAFVRGEGTALFDPEGRPYLDFLTGLAVTSLGHAHPAVTAAVAAQAGRLVHTSNLYVTSPAVQLAEALRRITGWEDARTFFANCGATANEAALKLARRHGKRQHPDKVRVVTLEGSFHGRTFATLEATGQPAKHEPFAPLLGVVDTVPWDDPEALRAAVTADTCAVLLEVVQGEGGVRPVPHDVLVAARDACDEHGALLVVDEVQTGIGRTGPWFAFHDAPIVPDVITVAKALANGLPIGACIARGTAAEVLARGEHASTFGGNPVTCAAALAVIETIERDDLLARAARTSAALVSGIESLTGTVPLVRGIRGRGLLLGVELASPVAAAVEAACRERFLLVNAVAPTVLRLAPPLIATGQDVALALAALREALTAVAETAGEETT
jgi:acetylornithine/N-succinyldiaminopimelate aminotransferase